VKKKLQEMAMTTPCPDARELRQLLIGEALEGEAEALEQHLLGCESCCTAVRGLADADTFVEALRSSPTLAYEPEAEILASMVARVGPGGQRGLHVQEPSGGVEEEAYPYLAPAESSDELGRLGSCRVLAELGRGGMGVVFRAEDLALKRTMALKVMRPCLAEDRDARQRFLREAQAAAAVAHENVVTIYHVGEDRGVPYLAMQLLEGETLEERLAREGRLPMGDVLRIGRQITEGLAAAHEQGLVHRDVKPANVWLEDRPSAKPGPKGESRVKLLDFGLARAAENAPRLTLNGAIVGTPGFLAPEQARGAAVDARSDLFSLGCVLYQMSTGTAPFHGPDTLSTLFSLALDQPAPASQVNPQVPEPLSNLIIRLLHKDPARRPASARDVADGLAAIAPETTPNRAASPRRMISLVAAAVMVGAVGVWAAVPGVHRNADERDDVATASLGAADDAAAAADKEDEKEVARGYAVAILPFEERGLGAKDTGAKITSLLNAKLGDKPAIFLVDREDLRKTLEEAELNLSGAVKPSEANRVGQITGARLLVTGSVFQEGKTLHVVAKIVGTETTRVRPIAVEGRIGDELGPLVDKLADKVAEVVTKDADKLVAPRAKEVNRIAELNQQFKKGVRPTLWISVGEQHVGQARLDPAAQTELVRIARGAGFTVLDPDEAGKGRADVIITGAGISEFAMRRGGLVSVRARVELKAVDRKTDQVLASEAQTVIVVDLSEQIAGKTALQDAAGALAMRVLPKLVKDK
jgi:tRNA A-37 threonylcarbamoyl transferase component Bud32/TolB-like protein